MITINNQCIIIANSNVYNITEYIDSHPDGSNCLWEKSRNFTDCSSDFFFTENLQKKDGKNIKLVLLNNIILIPVLFILSRYHKIF